MLPAYPDIPRYHHHHHHHRNHCVSHQEPPLPNPTALHTPAAYLVDEEGVQFLADGEMYHQHQETLEAVLRQQVTAPAAAEMGPVGNGVDGGSGGGAVVGAPRKRPFRTDRHSKIRTAQGVRDRRMRLSVGVARDFFALQDLLGFDKASKTVDWLLTQSKPAIDRLADAALGAAVPGSGAAAGAGPAKEKGEAPASSSSTDYFRDARAVALGNRMNNSIGGDGSPMTAALMPEEHGGGEDVDWFMSEATSAAAAIEQQPMDGLDYYYQYYQLEEMMRAATTEDRDEYW